MTAAKVALALVAGLVVLVLLFPAGGIMPFPPVCYSVFGYVVTCDALWAVAAGTAVAVVVGLTVGLRSRRARRGYTYPDPHATSPH